jgi:hypothetical protein
MSYPDDDSCPRCGHASDGHLCGPCTSPEAYDDCTTCGELALCEQLHRVGDDALCEECARRCERCDRWVLAEKAVVVEGIAYCSALCAERDAADPDPERTPVDHWPGMWGAVVRRRS